jgi:hypothetical protein
MAVHFYLSMVPESLIASMLPPKEFGAYLAVGTRKRSRGPAIFCDLKEDFRSEPFDLDAAAERCTPHEDGTPKHSVYVSIYRVLERIPLEAVRHLFLVTRDGRVLELAPADVPASFEGRLHLYAQVCPVRPVVASSLDPREFTRFITDTSRPVSVPRLCFAELELGELAEDPAAGDAQNLPYHYLDHLRDCLQQLDVGSGKPTKTVDRTPPWLLPYRCIKSGIFLGDATGLLHFPMPDRDELENTHHDWWRSANV